MDTQPTIPNPIPHDDQAHSLQRYLAHADRCIVSFWYTLAMLWHSPRLYGDTCMVLYQRVYKVSTFSCHASMILLALISIHILLYIFLWFCHSRAWQNTVCLFACLLSFFRLYTFESFLPYTGPVGLRRGTGWKGWGTDWDLTALIRALTRFWGRSKII